jgi:glycerol kinase
VRGAAGPRPRIQRCTTNRLAALDPYFSATKLAWLLERTADGRSRAARGELAFGTVDSWLVHHLTGRRAHVTDRSNASRTLLLNIASGEWDQSMLDLFDVPRGCLATLLPSSIPPSLAPLARIDGCDVPITGIAGDQQAALFGQLCFQPGMAKNTYGTGCFALMNMGGRPLTSRHRLLTTIAWDRVERCYAIEGSVFVGGAVVQWLRDGLGLIEASSEIEPLAATVADAGGVVLVPAFTGLGAPHWDPHARGAIVGLSRGTTRGHLARAALESIAFQCAELLEAKQQAAARPLTELRVDGGASVNDLLMQFQADLLGLPIVRPRVTETTALGAAYLAGLAVGFWSSTEELSHHWQVERVFEPQLSRDNATFLMNRWARAVQRARAWNES